MEIDPVCKMEVSPDGAAATAQYKGRSFYFCSSKCHQAFTRSPERYAGSTEGKNPEAGLCLASDALSRPVNQSGISGLLILKSAGNGAIATAALLGLYFGILTLVSGWNFTLEQFSTYWHFITALALGFGVQVGLYSYLKNAIHQGRASGKVVAATGTTSGAAMVSCCAHYLANLLPALGATGLVALVGEYQVELFWFGLASNLLGIAYLGSRVVQFSKGVQLA